MEHCQTTEIEATVENEDDVMRLANFHEDLHDYASKLFRFQRLSLPIRIR
jgi:hypothetical protein